jgi:F0F1-type ATP synthase membrane subunit c/vacuolar-type H+-ATPase subunit K
MSNIVNKILSFFKEGAMSGAKISSKRIIMFTMTILIIAMICVEALFNGIIMYKWLESACKDPIEFKVVFSLVIYGYIFGIISALATANAYVDKSKVKVKENEDQQVREPQRGS